MESLIEQVLKNESAGNLSLVLIILFMVYKGVRFAALGVSDLFKERSKQNREEITGLKQDAKDDKREMMDYLKGKIGELELRLNAVEKDRFDCEAQLKEVREELMALIHQNRAKP